MRKISICLLTAILASVLPAWAKETKPDYITYQNAKYNYSVLYPSLLLNPLGEPDAHDGQRFESRNSTLKMRAWGTYANWSGEERSIAEEEKWTIENLAASGFSSDPKITYKANGTNWFVISGTARNTIFYQRTVKGGGPSKDDLVFASVWFEYPKSDKAKYDAVVKKVSRSLTALSE